MASKLAPSLAFDSQGTPYALFVANNTTNSLLLASPPKGQTKWEWHEIGGATKVGPALMIDSQDNFHAAVVADNDTNTLLVATRPKGQTKWTDWRGIGASRMGIVGAVDRNDALYVLFAANDDSQSLLLSISTDHGRNWRYMGLEGYSNFDIVGDYADSHEVRVVRTFEKGRLCCFRPRSGVMYSTSWTGTWHPDPSALIPDFLVDHYPCIDKMANDLNKSLRASMEEWVADGIITSSKRPNQLWVDYYDSDVLDTIEYLNKVLR